MELGAVAYKEVSDQDLDFLFDLKKLPGSELRE